MISAGVGGGALGSMSHVMAFVQKVQFSCTHLRICVPNQISCLGTWRKSLETFEGFETKNEKVWKLLGQNGKEIGLETQKDWKQNLETDFGNKKFGNF